MLKDFFPPNSSQLEFGNDYGLNTWTVAPLSGAQNVQFSLVYCMVVMLKYFMWTEAFKKRGNSYLLKDKKEYYCQYMCSDTIYLYLL